MGIAYAIPLGDTWGMHGDLGAGWMIGMMAIMVLFWGGIILGFVWLVRGTIDGRPGRLTHPPPDRPDGRETPTELLDRRFAEGTISLEDYQARRRVLAANGAAEANGAYEDEALVAPRA